MAFLKNIDFDAIKSKVEAGAKVAQEKMAAVDVDGLVKGAKDAVAEGTEMVGGAIGGIVGNDGEAQDDASTRELISLLWCLAYVDGTISREEKETLEELSHSLDEAYESYASEVEQDYMAKLQDASREFGSQNAAKIEAQRVIEAVETSPQDAKLLCWNLLALANSDGLDDSELDFIRFVSEKAGLEPAVFEELRNYSFAINEIGESIENLKRSEKSYVEIEPLVAEFRGRELEMVDAVQSLISDR